MIEIELTSLFCWDKKKYFIKLAKMLLMMVLLDLCALF